jgi:hypothetical protein
MKKITTFAAIVLTSFCQVNAQDTNPGLNSPIRKMLDDLSKVRVEAGSTPIKYRQMGQDYYVETTIDGKPGKTVVIEGKTKKMGKMVFRRLYTDVVTQKAPEKDFLLPLLKENDQNFGAWSYFFGVTGEGPRHIYFFSAVMSDNFDMVTLWTAIGHISATANEMETKVLNK